MAVGPAGFLIGQKVRVWYSSARAWKVVRIRAIQFHHATETYIYGLGREEARATAC